LNESLEFFKDRYDIFSISGYNYPPNIMKIPKSYKHDIYLSYRFGSWGWSTWFDRWNKVDWEIKDYEKFKNDDKMIAEFNRGGSDMSDMLISQMEGRIDSWAIRFDYAHFKNNCYNIRPVKSLVHNIGFDGSGVHCGESDKRLSEENQDNPDPKLFNVAIDLKVISSFVKIFEPEPKYSLSRFFKKCLKKVLS
jgi:hypothetical protein